MTKRLARQIAVALWMCASLTVGAAKASAQSGPEDEVSLLQLPGAGLDASATTPADAEMISAISDNAPETVASFEVQDGEPVDLVFAFPSSVGVSSVEFTLPVGGDVTPPSGFDVLVSTTSASSGFQSLSQEAFDPLAPAQTFAFEGGAANWAMIRLYPAEGQTSLALSEIDLRGTSGPPETVYAFGESPVSALDLIDGLTTLEEGFALTPEERELFFQAASGDLGSRAFEEVALFASGVVDPDVRSGLIADLDRFEEQLRQDIDLRRQPLEVGADLLTWIHEKVLVDRYRSGQTNLSGVIEDGTFNCVSSAVVYNTLGYRLGLDVRAIEVPDHAFSILYDGPNHVDIETTTTRGFNPRREQVAEFEALTGFQYIPERNRSKRREIGAAGLAALIYYNHGVDYLRTRDYQSALSANFRALSLDPDSTSASTNALAALSRWSRALSKEGRWEEALEVAALGGRLAPEDRHLVSREADIWKRWAISLSSNGEFEAALAVLARAEAENDDLEMTDARVAVFLQPAEAAIRGGDWDKAFSISELGLGLVTSQAREDIRDWRRSLYRRLARAELKAGNYALSAAALRRGLDEFPGEKTIPRSVRYIAQETARGATDFQAGLQQLAKLAGQFPDVSGIEDVAENYVIHSVRRSRDDKSMQDMLNEAPAADALLGDLGSDFRAEPFVYFSYGARAIDDKNWPRAAEIHAAGLERFPDYGRLKTNAAFLAQQWQRQALASGGAEELKTVNDRLRLLFPAFAVNPGFGEGEIKRKVYALAKGGDYDEARGFLNSTNLLISGETYRDLAEYIFDRRAQLAMKAKEWEKAARVYAEARIDLDEPKLFSNNVTYIAQEWTRQAAKQNGAAEVAAALSVLSELFPDNSSVTKMGKRAMSRLVTAAVREDRIDEAKGYVSSVRVHLSAEVAQDLMISLYRDWGDSKIDASDWEAALSAFAQGLAVMPEAKAIGRNVSYAFQQWTREVVKTGESDDFLSAVARMREIFPASSSLSGVLKSVLSKNAAATAKRGDPEVALDYINAVAVALDEETEHNVKIYLYDRWARLYFKKEWGVAVEIYARGLEDVGKSSLLSNNLSYARSKME